MIIWGQYRDDLQSAFADAVDACLGPLMAQWVVTSGYRSLDAQAVLYAKGRDSDGNVIDQNAVLTYAKPGSSAHDYGLAVDVALQRGNGQGGLSWDYSLPEYAILWAAVEASSTLHSGHDFPVGETDNPHIERLNWWQFKPAPESQT